MKWWLLIVITGLIGCQQKPTVGVTDSGVLVQKDYQKVVLENAIIFDTRSPFEFNTNKVPGSINLPVSDFQVDKDKMDAARRLSLYGVQPDSPVVIIGTGNGDEPKLAWEFIKLGITQVELLKSSVFKLMNIREEPPKKNVPLWKPGSSFDQLGSKAFQKKIESVKPRMSSRARETVFQGAPVAQAIKKRILMVADKDRVEFSQYTFADKFILSTQNFFDEKGLLNRTQKPDVDLKKYDVIFLLDSSPYRFSRAYALVQFGARSLYLAP